MTREEKNNEIGVLAEKIAAANVFYIADTAELSADQTSNLRRRCYKGGVKLEVVKNTLLKKALEQIEDKDFSSFYDLLKGPSSLMISEKGNEPAKIIREFRKKGDKPVLKAAYIEEAIYIGDDQVNTLADLKSKDELIGDIVGLLQSPAKNVLSALQSGGQTISGLVKALEERAE